MGFQTIRAGSGILGFCLYWCPSPFPLSSISWCFFIHSSSPSIDFGGYFYLFGHLVWCGMHFWVFLTFSSVFGWCSDICCGSLAHDFRQMFPLIFESLYAHKISCVQHFTSTDLYIECYVWNRLCLGIRHSDFGAQMLLDQSVMWSRKATNLWCDSELKFLCNDYANHNTNPKTLMALILTLKDPLDAFESFCAPVFCDLIRNYFRHSESERRTPRHFVWDMCKHMF